MTKKDNRFETIYTQGTSWSIVVDKETGVNYLIHDTGITSLLNKEMKQTLAKNIAFYFLYP